MNDKLRTERLLKLAHDKAQAYARRPGVVALAITGSLARWITLEQADPLTAIVRAREIAIRYGVAVYWMRRGKLLSSGMRIAEHLKEVPRIYTLFHAIFSLGGQGALEQFLADFETLPASIREAMHSDIAFEVMPMVRLGVYDGALVYIRQIIVEHPLADVAPVLGLSDDIEAQKQTVLAKARELVGLCGR